MGADHIMKERLAQRSEARANVLSNELRLFPGGKVPTFLKLFVLQKLGICALRPTPRALVDLVAAGPAMEFRGARKSRPTDYFLIC